MTPCTGAHLHLRGRAGVGAGLVADHAEDGHHYDGAAMVHQQSRATTLFYEESPEYQAQADVRPEGLTLAFLNNLVSGPNISRMTLTLMFLLTKKMRYTTEQAVRMKIREEAEIIVMVVSLLYTA